MPRYRIILYAATLLTGMTGLIYQVTWQKYLSFVVGSEARSVSLVVAVFLAGLAAGYRYWGRLTERIGERRRQLRVYGLVELGIGLYAAGFPLILVGIRWLSYHGPPLLLTDVGIVVLALALPTFLMGATIPLLVAVVPERAAEVHLCHARIYGVNTLGACLGAFGASFVLVPQLGLGGALLVGSAVNVAVGTLLVFNGLEGRVTKAEGIREIPHRFGTRAVYLSALVTGTIGLSLEVVFVRLLGLTVGAGPHNFAIVVGVFVFGLALGSLLLTGRQLSVRHLFGAILFLAFYLMLLFHSVPYWPYWLSNARVCLKSIPFNYDVYLVVVTGFMLILLLPFLVPLGSMLPLVYALLPKSTTDYAKKCGWLYCCNTAGTALGAIVLSHLGLHLVDLDRVFKVDVLLLVVLALYLFCCERMWRVGLTLAIVSVVFLAGPGWNRDSHYIGLFSIQEPASFHFHGLFHVPRLAQEVRFFRDGPDASVAITRAVVGSRNGSEVKSTAVVINGRGDGDTVVDLSTITLAAALPYLFAPDRGDLESAVIGLGTGTTAAILGRAEDVRGVDAVEISSTLVGAAPRLDPDNHELSRNPRVRILAADGFKYFTRLDRRLDLIVSATSAPWVGGVENLFSAEFYRLVGRSLNPDGVFVQWFPLYAMDAVLFRTVLQNVDGVFPHTRLYAISGLELAILASASALPASASERRLREPAFREDCARLRLTDVDELSLLELFEGGALHFLAREGAALEHSLTHPSLAYASDRIRFFGQPIDWNQFIDARLMRLTRYSPERQAAFARLLAAFPDGLDCTGALGGERSLCERFGPLWEARAGLEQPRTRASARVQAYDLLRQQGVRPPDPAFLRDTLASLIDHPPAEEPTTAVIEAVVMAYVKDAMWEEAFRGLELLRARGVIGAEYQERIRSEIERSRAKYAEFMEAYRRDSR